MSKAVAIPGANKDIGGTMKEEIYISPSEKKDGAMGYFSRFLRFDPLGKKTSAPGSPTTTEPPTTYYGVYIPCEIKKGPDEETLHVYKNKSEALELVRRYKAARFKAFNNRQDAVSFALRGAEPQDVLDGSDSSVMGEKPYPFKAPSPQDMVALRKAIEAGLAATVRDRVWDNPRFLVSSGNTPAIMQEGSRYNALHVAAKAMNAELCNLILTTVGNPAFIQCLYGADSDPACCKEFAEILLDRYLNTPDKAMNETPLHFAAKYGAEAAVDVITSFPQCDKLARNKYGETPKDVICKRASNPNPETGRRIAAMLDERFYVPVLHSEDDSGAPTIGRPFTPSQPPEINRDPLSPRYEIRAFAGPMQATDAEQFRRRWKTPPRHNVAATRGKLAPANFRLKEMSKGFESVGRTLANEMKVGWKEYWPFLDTFTDLRTPEGLTLLENYLKAKYESACSFAYSDSCLEQHSRAELSLSRLSALSQTPTQDSALSPMSELCVALKTCKITDRPPHWRKTDPIRQRLCRQPSIKKLSNGETPPTINHTVSQLLCMERTCQVFAKRIADALIFSLTAEPEVAGDSLKSEAKHLQHTILTYMDDERFQKIDFSLIHSRLAQIIVYKLKQQTEDFDDINNLVEFLVKLRCPNDDIFSSDDERKPTSARGPNRVKLSHVIDGHVRCLASFICEELTETECHKPPAVSETECAEIWEKAAKCRCDWKVEAFERNNKKTSSFRKNWSTLSTSPKGESFIRRLTFEHDMGDGNAQQTVSSRPVSVNSPAGDSAPAAFTVDVHKCTVVDAERYVLPPRGDSAPAAFTVVVGKCTVVDAEVRTTSSRGTARPPPSQWSSTSAPSLMQRGTYYLLGGDSAPAAFTVVVHKCTVVDAEVRTTSSGGTARPPPSQWSSTSAPSLMQRGTYYLLAGDSAPAAFTVVVHKCTVVDAEVRTTSSGGTARPPPSQWSSTSAPSLMQRYVLPPRGDSAPAAFTVVVGKCTVVDAEVRTTSSGGTARPPPSQWSSTSAPSLMQRGTYYLLGGDSAPAAFTVAVDKCTVVDAEVRTTSSGGGGGTARPPPSQWSSTSAPSLMQRYVLPPRGDSAPAAFTVVVHKCTVVDAERYVLPPRGDSAPAAFTVVVHKCTVVDAEVRTTSSGGTARPPPSQWSSTSAPSLMQRYVLPPRGGGGGTARPPPSQWSSTSAPSLMQRGTYYLLGGDSAPAAFTVVVHKCTVVDAEVRTTSSGGTARPPPSQWTSASAPSLMQRYVLPPRGDSAPAAFTVDVGKCTVVDAERYVLPPRGDSAPAAFTVDVGKCTVVDAERYVLPPRGDSAPAAFTVDVGKCTVVDAERYVLPPRGDSAPAAFTVDVGKCTVVDAERYVLPPRGDSAPAAFTVVVHKCTVVDAEVRTTSSGGTARPPPSQWSSTSAPSLMQRYVLPPRGDSAPAAFTVVVGKCTVVDAERYVLPPRGDSAPAAFTVVVHKCTVVDAEVRTTSSGGTARPPPSQWSSTSAPSLMQRYVLPPRGDSAPAAFTVVVHKCTVVDAEVRTTSSGGTARPPPSQWTSTSAPSLMQRYVLPPRGDSAPAAFTVVVHKCTVVDAEVRTTSSGGTARPPPSQWTSASAPSLMQRYVLPPRGDSAPAAFTVVVHKCTVVDAEVRTTSSGGTARPPPSQWSSTSAPSLMQRGTYYLLGGTARPPPSQWSSTSAPSLMQRYVLPPRGDSAPAAFTVVVHKCTVVDAEVRTTSSGGGGTARPPPSQWSSTSAPSLMQRYVLPPRGDSAPAAFTVDVHKCTVVDAEISEDESPASDEGEEVYHTASEHSDTEPEPAEEPAGADDMHDASDRALAEPFIYGEEPTKMDRLVFEALRDCSVSAEQFPNVHRWRHTVALYSAAERDSWLPAPGPDDSVTCVWPSTPGSPARRSRVRSSTPHKDTRNACDNTRAVPLQLQMSTWLRVTGPHSPRAALAARTVSHNVSFGC
ncbi:hypothetical protein O0L34_g9314 [Tuta absoluta]|nr:hypothetical protein O0L34_g9314 [Tuta absoluta]